MKSIGMRFASWLPRVDNSSARGILCAHVHVWFGGAAWVNR